MLSITADQVEALQAARVVSFADELAAHLRTFAPRNVEAMGADALHETIRLGLANARKHGFSGRAAVRFYVEVMLMLGSFFDADPQYHAIARELRAPGSELERADRLHAQVMAYVDSACGPDNEYELAALERVLALPPQQLEAFAANDVAATVGLLQRLHPEKVHTVGEAAVASLVRRAHAMAAERGPAWAGGGALFAALTFTFGHACFEDPQYPWLAAALAAAPAADAEATLRRVLNRYLAFLAGARAGAGVR